MFFKRKPPEPTPPEQIRRIVTTGFAKSEMDKAEVFFVEAEKRDDGKYVLYATNNYTHKGQPGYRRQILTEHFNLVDALSTMEEWDRLSRSQYPISGRPTGRNAPHFKDVARQLGVPVGPDMISRHHANRMKKIANARLKRRGP